MSFGARKRWAAAPWPLMERSLGLASALRLGRSPPAQLSHLLHRAGDSALFLVTSVQAVLPVTTERAVCQLLPSPSLRMGLCASSASKVQNVT